jgi:hypothetical protein
MAESKKNDSGRVEGFDIASWREQCVAAWAERMGGGKSRFQAKPVVVLRVYPLLANDGYG